MTIGEGVSWVAGVDGCKAGWIVALRNVTTGNWEVRLCTSFREVVSLDTKPAITAVDLPIGLLDDTPRGGRQCDREARQLLGQPRQSSVFSPPPRPKLRGEPVGENRPLVPSDGITLQALALLPKLRAVDENMLPVLQRRVLEIHPELCFYEANGQRPMAHRKKRRAGRTERLQVLEKLFSPGWREWWAEASRRYPRRSVALDDLLDAHIAAWTAERTHRATATRVPANPPTDSTGLRMEIWR